MNSVYDVIEKISCTILILPAQEIKSSILITN